MQKTICFNKSLRRLTNKGDHIRDLLVVQGYERDTYTQSEAALRMSHNRQHAIHILQAKEIVARQYCVCKTTYLDPKHHCILDASQSATRRLYGNGGCLRCCRVGGPSVWTVKQTLFILISMMFVNMYMHEKMKGFIPDHVAIQINHNYSQLNNNEDCS